MSGFPLPSSKKFDLNQSCKSLQIQRTGEEVGGGPLTPDVLRVAPLGHQFLDVIGSLGACHAPKLLGYLVENCLHVPRHVACISGRKTHLTVHERSTVKSDR